MHETLHSIYNECCEVHNLAAGDPPKSLLVTIEEAFTEAITWLHDNKTFSAKWLTTPAVKKLITTTNDIFTKAISKGIGQSIPDVMKEALQKDVFIFSGMKTYAQMKEASGLLLDEKGNIKPLEKFRQDVKQINAAYNDNYLNAEYHFATGSSQMAAKWVQYQNDGDRYYLQYRTAQDDRVRPEHQVMADTTLPVNDPFWNNYFPPNGWNCRCNVVQVLKSKYEKSESAEAIKNGEKATTQIGKDGKNKGELFRFNPGKTNKIFPPDHPYHATNCGKLAAIWKALSVDEKWLLADKADKCQAKKIIEKMADTKE